MFAQASNLMITGGHFASVQGDYHYNVNSHNGLYVLSQSIAPAAIFNSSQRFPPGKCHPGTRKRVIETIKKWILDPTPECKVAWLYGPAGSGKSAIAQTIAELLWDLYQTHYGGSFFFKAGDNLGRGDGSRLFSTLAYQLAVQFPSLLPFISNALLKDPTLPAKSMDIQIQALMINPILQDTSWPDHTPTIIIDGLDECADSTIQTMILSLISNSIQIHKLPVRFLIASRPEYWIMDAFEVGPLRRISQPISLNEVSNKNHDIETYLSHEFLKICEKYSRIMSSMERPWPEKRIIRRFVEEASGQFIYASTVIKFVGYSSDFGDPRDRLQTLLISGPHRAAAFSNLDKLYATILSRIPDSHQAALKLVLGGALIDLTVQAIEKFLGVHDTQMGLILNYLSPLIHVQHETFQSEECLERVYGPSGVPEESRISFYHLSFREFLENESRSGKYSVDGRFIHRQLWLDVFDLIGFALEQSPQFKKHRTYTMNAMYFQNLINSMDVCCIPHSSPSIEAAFNLLHSKIKTFVASGCSDNPYTSHLLPCLEQFNRWVPLIDMPTGFYQDLNKAQLNIICHVMDNNKDKFDSVLCYAEQTYLSFDQYRHLPEVHLSQDIQHILLNIEWQYERDIQDSGVRRAYLRTTSTLSNCIAFSKRQRWRARWNSQVMQHMCLCLNLLAKDGVMFSQNPTHPRLLSPIEVGIRRHILLHFLSQKEGRHTNNVDRLRNEHGRSFLTLMVDSTVWDAFYKREVGDIGEAHRVTCNAMQWMHGILINPLLKSKIADYDTGLPDRMSQMITRLYSQYFLPRCQSNRFLNELIVVESIFCASWCVILKLESPVYSSAVHNLGEKRIPPPHDDLLIFWGLRCFQSDFFGQRSVGSSRPQTVATRPIIEPCDWYPYMASYCLNFQVKEQYLALRRKEYGHNKGLRRRMDAYLVECLPHAFPTQQNLTALRTLRSLSPQIPRPWHPPAGFCLEVTKLLKKYHIAHLPVAELIGFMGWLSTLVEDDVLALNEEDDYDDDDDDYNDMSSYWDSEEGENVLEETGDCNIMEEMEDLDF